MHTHRFYAEALSPYRHKVLLLHDDQQFVGEIGKLLSGDGRVQVLWVDNAFEAGCLTRQQVPELILLNAHLPDFNVCDTLRQVRHDRSLDGIRVLCLADLEERERFELLLRGADEVLPPVCGAQAVVAAMYRHLGITPPNGENRYWSVSNN